MKPLIPPALLQTSQEVEEALEAVFARPEFAPPRRSPVWEWLGTGLRAAADFLRGLFPAFELGGSGRTLVFWLVLALLAAAAVIVSLRVAERLARGRRPWTARRAGEAPLAVSGTPETADGWEALAGSLAAQGRWREAAQALYESLLRRLAAVGAIRVDPAKTPGDYRRESRRDPESHRLLDRFLHGFEPLAYGGRPADAAAYQHLLDAVRPPVRRG